ncbi:unnamed protein product [Rhizophagus irregularis]|uniref:Uncharacterized protein n=1 Tax=Rhizophagus irregularis TaxID=588596 RepID=A0A916EKF2_9GLOM|nr:unnamed protein product [Rhizophagus irregularis]CAB5390086.1 unnamed protein product [Rhizophagus irregularis]
MALAPWDSGKSRRLSSKALVAGSGPHEHKNTTMPNTLEKVCHTDLLEGLQVSPSRRARLSFQTSAAGVHTNERTGPYRRRVLYNAQKHDQKETVLNFNILGILNFNLYTI